MRINAYEYPAPFDFLQTGSSGVHLPCAEALHAHDAQILKRERILDCISMLLEIDEGRTEENGAGIHDGPMLAVMRRDNPMGIVDKLDGFRKWPQPVLQNNPTIE